MFFEKAVKENYLRQRIF